MGGISAVARVGLRRRRWSLVLLAVLTGAAMGFALTAGVGAARAATAWARMRRATRSPDVVFSSPDGSDTGQLAGLRKVHGVSAVGAFTYTPVAPAPLKPGQDAGAFAALDDSIGVDVARSLIVSGRAAHHNHPDEITINERLAAKGFHVGQRVLLRAGFWPDVHDVGTVTIVGVHRGEFDLGANSANAVAFLSHRFVETHVDQVPLGPQPIVGVRLRPGVAARTALAGALGPILGGGGLPPNASADPVVRAIDVQRVAWTFLAAAAALAVLVAAGQALSRTAATRLADGPTFVGLGMRRRQVAAAGAAIGTAVAIPAAGIAVAGAILASPLVPRGLAQRADPTRGVRVEPWPLILGGLLLTVVLIAAGAAAGWRAARVSAPRPQGVRSGLRRAPLVVRLGSQWAIASSPRPAAISARSALVAVSTAVAGVLAVATFAMSADALFSKPNLHGWSFDAGLVAGADGPGLGDAVPAMVADPDVRDVAVGSIVDISVAGKPVEAYALEQAKGVFVHPTVLNGRPPAAAGEIALASGTLRDLHKAVGDTVQVATPDGSTRLKVVGVAVYPELGEHGDLAHMASLTVNGAAQLATQPVSSIALLRVRDGADAHAVAARHGNENAEVVEPFEPAKVRNLRAAGAAPWVLAAFLAALLLAAIAHALVMSVRARRSDIAVLRVLGLERRRVSLSVAAQATTTVVIGAAVGIPVGIVVGRVAWSLVASGLGVVNHPTVEPYVVAVVVAGAALLANAVAGGPGWLAARVRPAAVLRSE